MMYILIYLGIGLLAIAVVEAWEKVFNPEAHEQFKEKHKDESGEIVGMFIMGIVLWPIIILYGLFKLLEVSFVWLFECFKDEDGE
jgi:hypothetical protein